MNPGAPHEHLRTSHVCACGAPVHVLKTVECARCYGRRWRAEQRAARLADASCAQCGGRPVTIAASLLCDPCGRQQRSRAGKRAARSRPFLADREPATYNAAHSRVRRVRGPASAWPCLECGDPAAQWAYREGGKRERATNEIVNGRPQNRRWSPEPSDYDPLCKRCHRNSDHGAAPARRLDPEHQRRWRAESHARATAAPQLLDAHRAHRRATKQDRSDSFQARTWAKAQGIPVAPTGRLADRVLLAWREAGAPRRTPNDVRAEQRQEGLDAQRKDNEQWHVDTK